jgi:hypothetical protein
MATKQPVSDKTNILSIIGLVSAFFIPLVGLVLSIIGLVQINKRGEKGKGLAISGIVASVLIGLAQLLFVLLVIFAATSSTITLTTYNDSANGYSVKHPDDWTITRANEADGTKSVTFKKEDSDTGKSVGQVEVGYIPAPANGYSSDVLTAIGDSLKKTGTNAKVVYEDRSTVNGLDTLTLITTYDGENSTIKAKTTVILKKDNSVLVVATQTPEQNWDKYQDSFDQIHHTFKP